MAEVCPEEACRKAVSLGADYAEAWVDCNQMRRLSVSGSSPLAFETEEKEGFGLRVFKDGGQALVAKDEPDAHGLSGLVRTCVRMAAKASRLSEACNPSEGAPTKRARVKVKGAAEIRNLSSQEIEGIVVQITQQLPKKDFPKKYLEFQGSVKETLFANSAGCRIKSVVPRASISYNIVAVQGRKHLQNSWMLGHSGGFRLVKKKKYAEKIVSEAKEMRRCLVGPVKAQKKATDVVIGPELAGIIAHESCGHPFEADRIMGLESAQGGSSYADFGARGSALGSPSLKISDYAGIENSYGFYVFDDEGVKKEKTVLVESGLVKGFLHDRLTAIKTGGKSSGNARRTGAGALPIVRMSNTFFEKGGFAEEELFEGIKQGVYLKNFMEWNVGDLRNNQKYVGCIAYLVEKGRLTEKPVRPPTLEIKTRRLFGSVDAVGKNLELHAAVCGKGEPMQDLPVGIGGPSIRLRGVRLS